MKINIGDVVEVRYPPSSSHAVWNGFQFRITEITQKRSIVTGKVLKTVPTLAGAYPVGSEFSWGAFEALVIVEPKNDQPSPNHAYIDHIYERLVQNATPEELISLAERLDRAGKGGISLQNVER